MYAYILGGCGFLFVHEIVPARSHGIQFAFTRTWFFFCSLSLSPAPSAYMCSAAPLQVSQRAPDGGDDHFSAGPNLASVPRGYRGWARAAPRHAHERGAVCHLLLPTPLLGYVWQPYWRSSAAEASVDRLLGADGKLGGLQVMISHYYCRDG